MKTQQYFRPTKAMIDLQAIQQNIKNLKKFIRPNVQIIAVVKANAYGHGDVAVAQAALEAGATILAVATPDEALHIRAHFEEPDILILGASPVSFAPIAAQQRIMLTVYASEWVQQAAPLLAKEAEPLQLHIKVDSGMGRIGIRSEQDLLALYQTIESIDNVELNGIFTHFATADEKDTTYFDEQVQFFESCLAVMPKKPLLVHASNTAASLVKDSNLQYDAVRYGISMYGLSPSSYVESILPFALQPAFSLESELVHVKEIKKGESVGYGATYVAPSNMWIGTIPIGYADGVIRKLGGQEVLIDGQRMPIVGRICMDQCMVALPKAYAIGEKVTLIGQQGQNRISIDEWATKLETINYEIPCIITARVPRIYF
ncbi:alanine racemase [Lysinibacillus sp. fkY74-1]|nr:MULTISPECIES: alanine racemase [Lysinibacillus]MBE5085403.1 alanine racemase [Bacillus thuringiensis]AMO31941.1 alanine racemase [Lysinibacillus sphaericus]AMR88940.1 alanine racemase [Lysinibacillus sphaericus]ANA47011.1 alanine racemase [Lysinibacillus sphaericus]KZL46423.1 alanine racemase [Lysinibacillus sphaericus]